MNESLSDYGKRTSWHDPHPVAPIPTPVAVVQDRSTARYCVLKLNAFIDGVPCYIMVAGRTFEERADAVRSAKHLASEIVSDAVTPVAKETNCGDRV